MQEYDASILVSKYNNVSATILIDQVKIYPVYHFKFPFDQLFLDYDIIQVVENRINGPPSFKLKFVYCCILLSLMLPETQSPASLHDFECHDVFFGKTCQSSGYKSIIIQNIGIIVKSRIQDSSSSSQKYMHETCSCDSNTL